MDTLHTPLARLVLFLVLLALAGSIAGGAHYAAVDLPAQKNVPPPANHGTKVSEKCTICMSDCTYSTDYQKCIRECDLIC